MIGCKVSVNARTDVIYILTNSTEVIDVPTNYSTIQEAINHANSGDTIFVHQGVYYENVVINKSISLVGENVDSTIVDGGASGSAISIVANNVNVTRFTVKSSCVVPPQDSAIYVEHSSGAVISYNKIKESFKGISLYSSSNNVISSNTVTFNYYSGVYLLSSGDNVISGNIISDNPDGIYLYSSGDNVISGNVISENYDGVYLYSSSSNVFSGNAIFLNNYYGIQLQQLSSDNIIYRNNFNNTNQAQESSESRNFWNFSGEGNYWSDYKGQDLNGDGIGDDPYVIPENNQDNSPLMGMFSEFDIIFREETYNVAVISNSTISGLTFTIGQETGNRIIRFNARCENGTSGFSRITFSIELMWYPYIVLVDNEEVNSTLLAISDETYACLYFTYAHENGTITIISSEASRLYNELLANYSKLQIDLYNLNVTYYELQKSLGEFNASYQLLYNLNVTYYDLLKNYNFLLGNYSQLQNSYNAFNSSYQEHLSDYSEQMQNIQSLMYIFAVTTAIFLITTVYLSKRAHTGITAKVKVFQDEK